MPEKTGNAPTRAEMRTLLHTVAELLRHTRHLGPEAQALLADLIDELGAALESPEVPNAEIARLTESASQLVQAVAEKHDAGMLEAANERLEGAVVSVEARAPHLAELTRRLAEMLSNLGI
jgi:tryptophan 2,3-dioxygenase